MNETTVLYRLISAGEMELIRSVNSVAFPPRLFWKQTFHPVSDEGYATQMARTWNFCDGKPVYLIRFQVRTDFLQPYECKSFCSVGENWIIKWAVKKVRKEKT